MLIDGTNQKNLTNNPAIDKDYRISKDGKKIFFQRERLFYDQPGDDIWSMDMDGGNQINLINTEDTLDIIYDISEDKVLYYSKDLRDPTQPDKLLSDRICTMNLDGTGKDIICEAGNAAEFRSIHFSPQGRIFFTMIVPKEPDQKINREIFTINPDGSDFIRLTTTNDYDEFIDDISSTKIVFRSMLMVGPDQFYDLYIMNHDKTNLLTLANDPANDGYAQFLDDGTITFISDRGKARDNYDIYSIYPDGSNLTRLTDNSYCNTQIAIRPKTGEKVGSLEGTLKGGTETIEGGRIELLKDNTIIRTAMSNSSGGFIIENIPLGLYILKAKAKGFQTGFYQ
ncbi:MAG: hypothetical protein AAB267_10535, partial [Candidatus Desantisbacteria bacterium]